jgi:hypothetical protein
MWLTIFALLIPVLISLISIAMREFRPYWVKSASIVLTLAGLITGIYSAYNENYKAKFAAYQQHQRDSIQLAVLKTAQDSLNYAKN